MIGPLFLDDLRAEFERLKRRKDKRRRAELRTFQKRLGEMKLFDPACGCGNFLIIAYRELRRGRGNEMQQELDAELLSWITVDQFYGIEIGEFPARIAETALWMMDHIMNNRLSLAFGQSYVRIPLEGSPHILNADALETDWTALLPPEDCSFVFGNPPFGGAKYQSEEQRAQVRKIAALGKSGGTLDYVTAWFIKAGEYIQRDEPASASSLRTQSHRESRWRNSGRCCSTVAAWRSPSLIEPSRGVPTRAARRTCMS